MGINTGKRIGIWYYRIVLTLNVQKAVWMTVENTQKRIRKRLKKHSITFDKVEKYVNVEIKSWLSKAFNFGYDREDLINEAGVVFSKCLDKYEGESIYGSHFFSFFTTSLFNHFDEKFNRVRNGKGKRDPLGSASAVDESVFGSNPWLFLPLEGKLEKAPEIVKQAFNFMLNASEEELERLGFRKKGGHGFKSNRRFCEALGYDPATINIPKEIKKFIKNL